MYFIYIDEAGDPGPGGVRGATDYYALSGLAVPVDRWHETFDSLRHFRSVLAQTTPIARKLELHGYSLFRGKGDFSRNVTGLKIQDRLAVYRAFLTHIASMKHLRVLNLIVQKDRISLGQIRDIFEVAWTRFVQRFQNFLSRHASSEFGLVFCDKGREAQTQRVMRMRRAFNPIPSQFVSGTYQEPWSHIVEDPVFRDSMHAPFLQVADMICYALAQREYPCSRAVRTRFTGYFLFLRPVLLTEASRYDPLGIVEVPQTTSP